MNELIDALRICGHASGCPEFCPRYRTYEDGLTCAQHVIFDAADAIAKLIAERKQLREALIRFFCSRCDSYIAGCEDCPIIEEINKIFGEVENESNV